MPNVSIGRVRPEIEQLEKSAKEAKGISRELERAQREVYRWAKQWKPSEALRVVHEQAVAEVLQSRTAKEWRREEKRWLGALPEERAAMLKKFFPRLAKIYKIAVPRMVVEKQDKGAWAYATQQDKARANGSWGDIGFGYERPLKQEPKEDFGPENRAWLAKGNKLVLRRSGYLYAVSVLLHEFAHVHQYHCMKETSAGRRFPQDTRMFKLVARAAVAFEYPSHHECSPTEIDSNWPERNFAAEMTKALGR